MRIASRISRWSSLALITAASIGPAASATTLSIVPGESEVRFLMRTTWHKVIGATTQVTGSIESA